MPRAPQGEPQRQFSEVLTNQRVRALMNAVNELQAIVTRQQEVITRQQEVITRLSTPVEI